MFNIIILYMIIDKYKKKNITIYIVDKNISDEKMMNYETKTINNSMIDLIIKKDADIYNKENVLLAKFRKKIMNPNNLKSFYDNVIDFAMNKTSNRGSTSGQKKTRKNVKNNPKVMANILGYMDGFGPSQKSMMKKKNIYPKFNVRETRFNIEYPEKWNKSYPLIKEINDKYAKYIPQPYKKQKHKADQTHYKIKDTAFTSVTTNINFKTHIHKDKGDDEEGFGNLIVIEDGNYEGSETCFPQYGIGIDVRQGDILFMNVHEYHGNLPMKPENKKTRRMSVVCYLRLNIWKITKHIEKSVLRQHDNLVRKLGDHSERPLSFNETMKMTR